jgi:hypothetical protein
MNDELRLHLDESESEADETQRLIERLRRWVQFGTNVSDGCSIMTEAIAALERTQIRKEKT